jgi:endonuclease YncB( thermonuclease family)
MTSNTSENRRNQRSGSVDSGFLVGIKVLLLALIGFGAGCIRHANLSHEEPARTMIAPLATEFPYELEGIVRRNWGGDEFEIIEDRVIHYVRLNGVTGPEPGQPNWRVARRLLWKGFVGNRAKVQVIGRDDCMCEIGSIRVGDTDLGLKLLENGMGCLDAESRLSGDDGIDWEVYRAAEIQAKQKKLGIWSDSKSLLPRDYRRAQEGIYLEFLKGLNSAN